MHHENVSGVNALLRGLDRLSNARLPAAVIMCTNRFEAIDPAVRRRAADVLMFGRPNDDARLKLLGPRLDQLGFGAKEIDAIVTATGPRDGQPGFTYSDLTQRLIPGIVLDAYPERAIEPKRALVVAMELQSSPRFND